MAMQGRPRAVTPLAQPLTLDDTPESLLRELREAAEADREAEANAERTRSVRDRWIKSAISARMRPVPLCEAAGVSKATLYAANKTEQAAFLNLSPDELMKGVKASSTDFKSADLSRDDARAERNERIARAFAAGIDVEAIAEASGASEDHVYKIAKGYNSKRRINA